MRNYLLFKIFLLVIAALLSVGESAAQTCVSYPPNSTSSTPVSCRGGSDGTITVTVVPGTSGFHSFLLQRYDIAQNKFIDIQGPMPTASTTYTFTGLIASQRYRVVTFDADESNCDAPANTGFITVSQPNAALRINLVSKTNIENCFGDATGGITVTASGGNSNYEYTINGTDYFTSGTFSGLVAGDYTVRVRDSKGCLDQVAVAITQPTRLIISLTAKTDPLCAGSTTGSIAVSASGSTPGYLFSINGSTPGTGSAFSSLPAGTYTIEVTDSKGCKTTLPPVSLTDPATLTAAIDAKTDVSCNGGSDGSATVTVTGGTAPHTLRWNTSPAQTNATATSLTAGTYTVTVTDANGCTQTAEAIISQPPAVAAPVAANAAICTDNPVPVLTASGTDIRWYDGNNVQIASGGSFKPTIDNTVAGTYTYYVTQTVGGCESAKTTVTLTVNAVPAAPAASDPAPICTGQPIPSLSATGTGIVWYDNSATVLGTGNPFTPDIDNAVAGTYTFYATQTQNDCESNSTAVTITIHPSPAKPVITGLLSYCAGGNTLLTSGASSGNQWYKDRTLIDSATGQTLTVTQPGRYTVTVTNANNCSAASDTATVTQTPQPAAPEVSDVTYCQGAASSALTATGNNLLWYSSATGGTGSATAPVPSTATAGTVDFYVSQTVNGCESTRARITVTVNPSPAAPVASGNGPVCEGSTLDLRASPISGAAYSWTGPNGFTATGQNVSIPGATSAHSGTYTATVTVSGCTNAATVDVTVNLQPATPVISGGTAICGGSSTVLSSGAATGNQWFMDGAAIDRAVGQSLTVATTGNYYVVVTNTGGCSAQSAAVTVTAEPGFSVSLTGTNPGSCSSNDGRITATATPAGSYAYSLNGSGFSNTTGVFNGLGAGNYTVYVRNTAGCVVQQSYTLSNGTFNVAVSTTGETACDALDGTITMTPSGGTGPYKYYVSGGNADNFLLVATSDEPYQLTGLDPVTYWLRIEDNNNCRFESTATVAKFDCSQPACMLTASGTQSNPTCSDPDGGSITLTAGGGTASYAYSLDGVTFQSSNVLIGLSAGTYNQVTVRDAAGCTQVLSFTLTAPAAPAAPAATSPAPVCAGSPVPQLTATGSGLKWYSDAALTTQVGIGSPFTPSLNNTVAGTTTFYVTQTVNGCESRAASVTVTFTAPPDFNVSKTDPSACSSANGSITVSGVTGGDGSYRYSLNGTTYQGGNTFTGLGGGNYTVYVRSTDGCVASRSVSLAAPGGFTAMVTSSNETGCDMSDGIITVSGLPGAANTYTYYLNGEDNGAGINNNLFSGLIPGTYTVLVKDLDDCTFTAPATVGTDCVTGCSVNASVSALVNPSCNGSADGRLTVSATGGSGVYGYSRDGVTFQSSAAFTGLPAGDYTITVRDRNNLTCQVVLSGIALSNPPAVSASVSATDPTCVNNNGSLTVKATGGDGNYSYSIDGGATFSSSNVFGNLPAGTYTVAVKDGKNCTISLDPVTLNAGAGLTASVSGTNPTGCSTSDGTITISSVTGGTGPYSYSLNGVVYQSGSTFSNLGGGSYTIYIRDSKGCQTARTQTLTAPEGITASTSWTAETACNAADGSVTVTNVSGAAGPFQYFINGIADPDGNGIFPGLAPATYTIRVVAANNCEYTTSVTVGTACTTTPVCTLTAGSSKTDPTCADPDGGSITVTPSGGTAPYSYAFNSTTFVAGTGSFTNLPAGDYNITIKDANDCTFTLNTITLVAPSVPAAPLASNPAAVCAGSAIPALTADGTDIKWYDENNVQVATGSSFTPALDNTAAGNYTFSATQTVNGCESSRTTVTLTVNAAPAAPAVADAAYCQGTPAAALTADGSNLLWYSISTGGTGSSTAPVPSTASVGTTEYYVSQTVSGCESTRARLAVTVNGNQAASVSITADQTSVCPGTPVTFTATATNGGTAPAYQWRVNGTGVSGATGAVFTSSTLSNNDVVTVVMTASGNTACITGSPATSNAVTIAVTNSLAASVSITADQTSICPGTPVTFTATATNGGTAPVYQWRINGAAVAGTVNSTFTSSTLNNNDVVTVVMTAGGNNIGCITGSPATSNAVAMTVSSNLTASVSITADQTSVCPGTPVTFTATATNGGTAPAYQWRVNGTNVAGATGVTFSSSTLANNDRISVLMTVGGTGTGCISGSPATSNVITMSVSSSLTASVSITADQNNVCAGTPVTFTATATNGGTAPVYQWRVNGTGVSGATGTVFTSSTLNNNDVVSVVMTAGGDNTNCVTGSPAASNVISMVIKPTTDPSCGCNLSIASTTVNARCQGDDNGEIMLFVISGGSGSYEYRIGDTPYKDSPDFRGLAAGTYTLTVRDKVKDCNASTLVTIGTNFIIERLVITRTPANRCGGTGSIDFTEISGTGTPYQVSIDGGATYHEWPAGRLFPNLNPATYPVVIMDASGCTYNTPIEITVIPSVSLAAAASKQPGSCSAADGEITLTVTGGTAPFQYSVNNGPVAANASGKIGQLAPGDYVITVKDASGCEATATLSLAVDPINFTVDAGEATCGNPTVTVKAVLPATADVTRYRFSINGSTFQASPEFRNVAPGIYTMHVRLNNGTAACPATKEFAVNGVTAISYRVSQVNIGCEGGEKGSITVSEITGGTTANSRTEYGISIDNGVSFRYTGSNTITFTDLAPGSYKVVLEYGNGCRTPAQDVLISSGGIPFTVKTTPSTCGSPNGTAEAEVLNNTAGKRYFYSINNTNFFETTLFVNLQPGEYRMYIRENASDVCPNILPFMIPGPDSVKFDMKRQGCNNLVLTNIRGGQPPYRVSIDGGNTFVSGNLFTSSFTVSNLRDGDYVVVIADNQNCLTLPANVRIGNTLTARIRATLSMADEPTGEIQVLDIRGGNGPYEVSLNGADWSLVKDNTIPYDTTIRNQPIGLYNVYIRDANGCVKVYNTEVKESRFLIPNIFTPNGDGVNDTFFIRNLPPSTIVRIVNRWGKVIFESANYQNDWKGGDYPDGVYFYTVNIAGGGTFTGWVQIWR